MLYLCLKYLHIIAAIFLFGFGMGSYLYLIAASRTANPQIIAHVARTVVQFDTWITTPAGFIQIGTGYLLMRLAGLPPDHGMDNDVVDHFLLRGGAVASCAGAPEAFIRDGFERAWGRAGAR